MTQTVDPTLWAATCYIDELLSYEESAWHLFQHAAIYVSASTFSFL